MRLPILLALLGLLCLGPWLISTKEGHGADPMGQPSSGGGDSDPTIQIPAGLDPDGQPAEEG